MVSLKARVGASAVGGTVGSGQIQAPTVRAVRSRGLALPAISTAGAGPVKRGAEVTAISVLEEADMENATIVTIVACSTECCVILTILMRFQCLRSCPFVLAAATITLLLDISASQIHQNELITSY